MTPPPRRYVYIALARLNELIGEILARQRRGVGRLKSGGLQVLGSGFTYELATPDEREAFHRGVEAIEKYLEGTTGTADEPARYFREDNLSMFTAPFDEVKPAVLYFTGESSHTVVALAGPLDRKVGLHRDDATSREGARSIIDEPDVASAYAEAFRLSHPDAPLPDLAKDALTDDRRWERDVVETYRTMTYYPQWFRARPVEFLAWTDTYTAADDLLGVLDEPKNVLIGKPLFVAEPG